jgi:hypothetical protein
MKIPNYKSQITNKFQIQNYKLQTKKKKLERSEAQPAEITNSNEIQINQDNWAVNHLLFGISVIVIWNLFVIWNL